MLDLFGSPLINGTPTTYTWKYANSSVVPSNLYTNNNGKFTFHGLKNGDAIYCEMTNAQFPDLTLRTTDVTISNDSVDVPYNAHDWAKVEAAKANNGLLDEHVTWENIGGEMRLTEIYATWRCESDLFGSLDLSDCTELKELNFEGNRLTSLNVSGCTLLRGLGCACNGLTSLNVSDCTALFSLDCSRNQLTSLDVSGCTALGMLNCGGNRLTSLDVSENMYLWRLFCSDNNLKFSTLHVSDEGIGELYAYMVVTIPSVLEPSGSVDLSSENMIKETKTMYTWYYSYEDNAGNYVDGMLDASRYTETDGKFVFHGLSDGWYIWCEMTNAESFGDTVQYTNGMLISSVRDANDWNVVNNQNLHEYAYWGMIDGEARLVGLQSHAAVDIFFPGNLDLSGCTALEYVELGFEATVNGLTSLDVSGCTALKELSISAPQLTSLKVNISQPFSLFVFSEWDGKWYIGLGESEETTLTRVDVVIQSLLPVNGTLSLSDSPLFGNMPLDYAWYYANGTLVPASLYTNNNGKFTFHGLTDGTKIYCEMTNNANFEGLTLRTTEITMGNSVVIIPAANPVKPKVTKSSTLNSVTLSWSANDRNAEYVITCTSHKGIAPRTITGTSTTFTGLEAGKSYKFTVVAKNADGKAAKTVTVTAKTLKYTAVKSLRRIATGLYSVALTWKEPAKVKDNPTTGYTIKVFEVNGKKSTEVTNQVQFGTINESNTGSGTGTASVMITELSAKTKYRIEVQAVASELGVASAIAKASATTLNPAKYPVVSGFKATVDKSTNAVTLSWKESKVPDTTHYEVVVRDAEGVEHRFDVIPGVGGVTVSGKGVMTIPQITDLELGKYTILVRAVTTDGIKSMKDAKKVITLK